MSAERLEFSPAQPVTSGLEAMTSFIITRSIECDTGTFLDNLPLSDTTMDLIEENKVKHIDVEVVGFIDSLKMIMNAPHGMSVDDIAEDVGSVVRGLPRNLPGTLGSSETFGPKPFNRPKVGFHIKSPLVDKVSKERLRIMGDYIQEPFYTKPRIIVANMDSHEEAGRLSRILRNELEDSNIPLSLGQATLRPNFKEVFFPKAA